MGKDAVGTVMNPADGSWPARVLQSLPATYTVWKDGSTFRGESNTKGGTDGTPSTDFNTLFQSVIDAMPNNGGIIFVRAGIYDGIDTTFTIKKHSIYVIGEGFSRTYGDQATYTGNEGTAIFKAAAGFSDYFFTWGDLTSAVVWNEGGVINLCLSGNDAVGFGAGGGIQVLNTHGFRLKDCTIQRINGKAFYSNSNISGYLSNFNIEHNLLRSINDSGIYLVNTGQSWIKNNYLSSCTNYGILNSSSDNFIVNNFIESQLASAGTYSGTAIYQNAFTTRIYGNRIASTDYHGIYLAGRYNTCSQNLVTNANGGEHADGSAIMLEGGTNFATVEGNYLYDDRTPAKTVYGINAWTDAGSVTLISDNFIVGALTATINAFDWSRVRLASGNYGFGTNQFMEHHTGDDTLTLSESGTIHTNLNAGANIKLTLPQDAVVGTQFEFAVMTAGQQLQIDPGAAGAIYVNGAKQADDAYIWADDEGESVKLVCDGNHDWIALYTQGTWTVV